MASMLRLPRASRWAGLLGGARRSVVAHPNRLIHGRREREEERKQKRPTSNESKYEFGNILFGGPCNQKCPFCIGKQLPDWLTPNNLRVPPAEMKNLDKFIDLMKASETKKIIFTGTRTDPQLYKYEGDLIALLRSEILGVHISLHTNGLLAQRKIDVFNEYDNCTISINTFEPSKFKKLHGVKSMPNLEFVMKNSKIPIKLSCVLTDDNVHDFDSYLCKCAEYGVQRLSVRHLFGESYSEKRYKFLFDGREPVRHFRGNPVYDIEGMEVTHWTFEDFSKPSINLFSDGSISTKYLLTDVAAKSDEPCS
mmetsp:Transcript_26330/g.36712  ORF Transcript_26330/g.36712 Transcript_26330/m.36712 type:complete len:309 (+) Transcript_26330:114-1040(+)|eukprot:CAMPEP_0184490594 /NCGR_PEP_ID=MMETSP0113_2-20130426/18276_1 /TAXON_ID=91329 /ORGANISM="Norrisiella sphaerica, Strain BC52" /LENGTH=308 /DNA_ID=CAMNT_0026874539 /DNA_START=41 /DNA_END=967 /DNA_ORIENTATION=-